MKNSKVLKSILFISGLIGVGIGAAILLTPTGDVRAQRRPTWAVISVC